MHLLRAVHGAQIDDLTTVGVGTRTVLDILDRGRPCRREVEAIPNLEFADLAREVVPEHDTA
jgi:hypothetical protein